MSFTAGLAVGLVALIVLLSLPGLRGWLDRRQNRKRHPPLGGRTEECEVCGAEISIVVAHLVTATFADDEKIGMADGGTAMSAAYCSNHCPGGCRLGCEALSAS